MGAKLPMAALTMGMLSFVHFFGVEKALMAVAFGVMAIKDPAATAGGRRTAAAAIFIGIAYLAVLAGVLLFHMPALNEMASKLAR